MQAEKSSFVRLPVLKAAAIGKILIESRRYLSHMLFCALGCKFRSRVNAAVKLCEDRSASR